MVKVTQNNFDQFLQNQSEFAQALNHRMSKIEADVSSVKTSVSWITKLMFIGVTILTAVFIAVVTKGI